MNAHQGLLLAVLCSLAVVRVAAQADDSPQRNSPVQSDGKLPSGLTPAAGAAIDAATGLPQRAIHEASSVTLVLVPSGEFMMGEDQAKHRRIVRRPFYLAETEVTVAQFRRFADGAKYQTDAERGTPLDGRTRGSFAHQSDGSQGGPREWSDDANWRTPFPYLGNPKARDGDPVVHVSWNDATAFARHFGFRLPTEAEWEYACRAGTTTLYFWGDDPAGGEGYANLADKAHKDEFPSANVWFSFDDGAAVLSPAGKYKSNPWGLTDMLGNVEEWVQDPYAKFPGAGSNESAPAGGTGRVVRGRSWLDGPGMNRAAMPQAARRDFIGFRVALSATP